MGWSAGCGWDVGEGVGVPPQNTVLRCCWVCMQAAKPKVAELAHQLAMHAAGMKPQFLDRASVPSAALDKERAILKEQVGVF